MEHAGVPESGTAAGFRGTAGPPDVLVLCARARSPRYAPMMAGLRRVFDTHARDGQIVLPYQTLVYFGRLGP